MANEKERGNNDSLQFVNKVKVALKNCSLT